MEKDKISVVVPIYNVEKFLPACVDSILAQTYQNLEVILVDDGSPDGCPAICDEYAKKDSRIKVIHKPNGGLSDARNAGIDIATGKYIAFVDSDDCCVPTMYEKLHNIIEKEKADIAICGFSRIDEDGKAISGGWSRQFGVFGNENSADPLFTSKNVGIIVAWNKLYNRNIFENIRYPKGMIHEDEYVIYDILSVANKVVIFPDQLYLYRQRNNSIVKSRPSRKMFDAIKVVEYRISKVGENNKNYADACSQLLNIYYSLYIRTKPDKELNKEVFDKYKVEYKKYHKFLNLKRRIKHILFRYFRIVL